MDADALRSLCLSFPGAVEERPFGPETTVFKVERKAIIPGYHLNKRHWNTVTLDGSLADRFVRDLVEDSYDLVVSALPKRVQARLGWSAQ